MSLIAHYQEQGIECAIIKHDEAGHLCGYAGVPPSHPWYGKVELLSDEDTQHIRLPNIDVHGGITYHQHEQNFHPLNKKNTEWYVQRYGATFELKGKTYPSFWARQIAEWKDGDTGHRYPVDTGKDLWWIGFDCAHLGDASPEWGKLSGCFREGVFRDETYVRREITSLVSQAIATAEVAQETPA